MATDDNRRADGAFQGTGHINLPPTPVGTPGLRQHRPVPKLHAHVGKKYGIIARPVRHGARHLAKRATNHLGLITTLSPANCRHAQGVHLVVKSCMVVADPSSTGRAKEPLSKTETKAIEIAGPDKGDTIG